MKKVNLLIFATICMFLFTAKTLAVSCGYSNADVAMAANKYTSKFDIENGELVNFDGYPVANWSSAKSEYQSKGTCPTYAFIAGGRLFLFYDYNEMTQELDKRNGTVLNSITYAQDTGDNSRIEAASRELKSLISLCNNVSNTKFDYSTCWDESKITTKYTECKNQANSLGSQIKSKKSEIAGYVSSGLISNSDSNYTTMQKSCESALKNISEYETALKYTSCKEYNEAMGTNIPCSTSNNNDSKKSNAENNDSYETYDDGCGGVFGDPTDPNYFAYYLKTAFDIIKFLGPILVVLTSIIDLLKITAEQKQDDQLQKLGAKTLKRFVYATIIFILPTLINYIFGLVGLYGTCGIS